MSHWKPATPSAWPGFKPVEEGEKPCPRCNEVLITRIRRRDWFAIITELGVAGVPLSTIAKAVGCSKSAVIAWKMGGEPKESDARKVLALYRRNVGDI